MADKSETKMAKEPAPCIYLADGQIEKYFGEDLEDVNVGDEKRLAVIVRVVEVSKRRERVYEEDGKDSGDKVRKSISLEIVGRGDKKKESASMQALKTLGRRVEYPK